MSEYYSTQTSVQAKVAALDIQHWLDPDGDGRINVDALENAMAEAKAEILSYVQKRYGATVTDTWDSDTRPDWIGTVSDWLTLYSTLPGYSAEHPVALRRYDESIAKLQGVSAYQLTIPGVDFQSGQNTTTTRAQALECTEEDAYSGVCDPLLSQYL